MNSESHKSHNVDATVVEDFGREWAQFDQKALSDSERTEIVNGYFAVFPWERLPSDPRGFDAGCGTGRWAREIAPRVGHLHCIDPSSAIEIAKSNLRHIQNCSFYQATVDDMPLADESMDFGYSLGVLHHVPDTERGILACVQKLKSGAPFLIYVYYAFDNQPPWFRWLWKVSDYARQTISTLPFPLKYAVTQVIAACLCWPLARTARVLEKRGANVHSFPLSFYRDKSFYSIRTDTLDRFGTKLERRFTKQQVQALMERAGLDKIRFSPNAPFWCAVGIKK